MSLINGPENYVLLKDRIRIFKIYHVARIGDFSFHFDEWLDHYRRHKVYKFFRTRMYGATAKNPTKRFQIADAST